MRTKKLEEFGVEIIGGQIIRRIEIEDREIEQVEDPSRKTIVAKTIGYGTIEKENIVEKDYKTLVDDAKYTRSGDIIVKLSAPYNAAYITSEQEGILVSSFCAIIRNIRNIDPHYLLACLNSDYCQKQLTKSVSGALIGILNNAKLKSLSIPDISDDKQQNIGKIFMKTVKNRQIVEKIIFLEVERINAIFDNLGE